MERQNQDFHGDCPAQWKELQHQMAKLYEDSDLSFLWSSQFYLTLKDLTEEKRRLFKQEKVGK